MAAIKPRPVVALEVPEDRAGFVMCATNGRGFMKKNMQLAGIKATVMGLGHFGGGLAVANWLIDQGAAVTVTDLADEATLAEPLAALAGRPIGSLRLGEHHEDDFRHADLVVVNPAVRPGNRFVRIARESGARITSELGLFIERCPAHMIGVTGSNGKSTTAAMIAAILTSAGRRCWLGGNLGGSLLPELYTIHKGDWVVLEISSFQLWRLSPGVPMPQIAVITGCSPNHLDWHADYADYVATKQQILLRQKPEDAAVLNSYDAEVAGWEPLVRGKCLPPLPLEEIPSLAVPGRHNRINAACAAAAALQVGCARSSVQRGLGEFVGLPNRLELVATVDGRYFYNDSAATTPESTIAALEAIAETDKPVWLLAGGKSKGADFADLAAAVAEKARGTAFFGSVGPLLHDWVSARAPELPCATTDTLDEAFDWCWQRSRSGDAVLLSPACSSVDQFQNYRHRAKRFVELVKALDGL